MATSKELLVGLDWEVASKDCLPASLINIHGNLYSTLSQLERLNQTPGGKPILIISGVSAGGKDSLVNELLKNPRFARVRTCTTRQEIRSDEINDDPYVRLSVDQFLKRQQEGHFLETEMYSGNWYGTDKQIIAEILSGDRVPIFRVNPRGASTLLDLQQQGEEIFQQCNLNYIFLLPENWRQLARRLLNRDLIWSKDQPDYQFQKDKVKKRWQQIQADLELIDQSHFILVNRCGSLGQSVSDIESII